MGASWRRVDLGVVPRSTMMAAGINPRRAYQVYCVTRDGQVFGSLDGGAIWKEYSLPPEAGEVYTIAVA
jgi:hypothetical protein